MWVRKLKKNDLKTRYHDLKRQLLSKSFEGMNERQREVVFSINGPVMVLAGAGSGKTTVLINRIVNMVKFGDAYFNESVPEELSVETIAQMESVLKCGGNAGNLEEMIARDKVKPYNILAITFTNKAANELKNRLSDALGELSGDVWASTFHSLCVRILRAHADKIGYTCHFAVYDGEDSKRIIKECQKVLKIDDKLLPIKKIGYEISHAKNRLVSCYDYKNLSQKDYCLSEISNVYEMYQKKLIESDAMDFDDLICNVIKLFKTYPELLEHYQNKFKYIMVDEYQDTNYAQFVLIDTLASKNKNLCVVGDDDQSIYKFRGATIKNIMDFDNRFRGAKVIRLEQNYRSTKNILRAANAVIGHNSRRKGKTLWTENEAGEKIRAHTAYSEHDEASFMAQTIQECIAKGEHYSDFAVLYRMNSQSNVIEKIFVKRNIPYRVLGGMRFYERKEVKDMLAYLSIIDNPHDEVRLRRIINQPRRSIGDRTITQTAEIAVRTGMTMLDVIRSCESFESLQRVSFKLKAFADLIDGLIAESHKPDVTLHDLYNIVLGRTGYLAFLKSERESSESRIENVNELLSNIIKYEEENGENATLSGFLEEVTLISDVDNYDSHADAVVMMTLHSAKGLEFPNVFIPGFEEGIFPGLQFADDDDSEVEEERRLAYVGITRSRKKLYILNSDSRMIFGSTSHNQPSRFLDEIPAELLDKTKSKDWKDLKKGEEIPRSAHEIKLRSVAAAHHFGQVSGGHGVSEKSASAALKYSVGDKVQHAVFGVGTVVLVTPVSGDCMIDINFEGVGNKKLLAKFARLTKAMP